MIRSDRSGRGMGVSFSRSRHRIRWIPADRGRHARHGAPVPLRLIRTPCRGPGNAGCSSIPCRKCSGNAGTADRKSPGNRKGPGCRGSGRRCLKIPGQPHETGPRVEKKRRSGSTDIIERSNERAGRIHDVELVLSGEIIGNTENNLAGGFRLHDDLPLRERIVQPVGEL